MACLQARSAFSFLSFIDLTPRDVNDFHWLTTMAQQIRLLQLQRRSMELEPFKEYVNDLS